ncbi:MAG: Uma2 family endonuclease [Hyphomicrobiaceae bacterium]
MQDKVAAKVPMTIEEFLAFYEERPHGEKWELIEGEPVMSSSPTDWHQVIAANIVSALATGKVGAGAGWIPALGVSTCVPASQRSLPGPDVMVFEHPLGARRSVKEDALVLFEVLSDSNSPKDQAWRRRMYASIPNCRHYVTVDSREAAVVRYDADAHWEAAASLIRLEQALALPALGIAFPLADIYRWTPLASPGPNKGE